MGLRSASSVRAVGWASISIVNVGSINAGKVFGETVRTVGGVLAKVVPNLQTFVPPRPLLLGQLPGVAVLGYIGRASANAMLFTVIGLALAAAIFRKRDFQ